MPGPAPAAGATEGLPRPFVFWGRYGEIVLAKDHAYSCRIDWTGNRGDGTRVYRGYDRTWDIATPDKPIIHCSNDPLLGGDPALPNPEDLLLASLSACHMLWYLHLASNAGVIVHRYSDTPLGIGEMHPDGSGQFREVILRPTVIVAPGTDIHRAEAIHHDVHRYCFIARSMNFPIRYAPTFGTVDR